MQQIKRVWNNQDLANKVILVTGIIMAIVCLVMGQGIYEDWFLLVEIRSVLLGGVCSIQLRYGGIRKLYFTPSGAHLSTEKHKKVGETPCNQRNKGI